MLKKPRSRIEDLNSVKIKKKLFPNTVVVILIHSDSTIDENPHKKFLEEYLQSSI